MTTRVIVVLLPDVHLLDLAGPVQVFYEANGFGGDYEARKFDVFLGVDSCPCCQGR